MIIVVTALSLYSVHLLRSFLLLYQLLMILLKDFILS